MSGAYYIVRMYQASDKPSRIIKRGLTLEEAQAHCRDKETSSTTCTGEDGQARTRRSGPWFEGYDHAN